MKTGPKPRPAIDRFNEKWIPEPNSGCWLWTGPVASNGYPRFSEVATHTDGRMVQAHRYAYEQFVGPIPHGLVVDHQCKNPLCVNPDHLKPMTQAENLRRYTSTITHCPRGHEYNEENTYINKKGGRSCNTCKRKMALDYYYEKRRLTA